MQPLLSLHHKHTVCLFVLKELARHFQDKQEDKVQDRVGKESSVIFIIYAGLPPSPTPEFLLPATAQMEHWELVTERTLEVFLAYTFQLFKYENGVCV